MKFYALELSFLFRHWLTMPIGEIGVLMRICLVAEFGDSLILWFRSNPLDAILRWQVYYSCPNLSKCLFLTEEVERE